VLRGPFRIGLLPGGYGQKWPRFLAFAIFGGAGLLCRLTDSGGVAECGCSRSPANTKERQT